MSFALQLVNYYNAALPNSHQLYSTNLIIGGVYKYAKNQCVERATGVPVPPAVRTFIFNTTAAINAVAATIDANPPTRLPIYQTILGCTNALSATVINTIAAPVVVPGQVITSAVSGFPGGATVVSSVPGVSITISAPITVANPASYQVLIYAVGDAPYIPALGNYIPYSTTDTIVIRDALIQKLTADGLTAVASGATDISLTW